MSELPGSNQSVSDLADGLALWEEHRPRTAEDWIEVARRCNHDGVSRAPMAPMLQALCAVVERYDLLRATSTPNIKEDA